MKKYDLWLDESGSFNAGEQTAFNKYPSLVGGILIEKRILSDREITHLVGQELLSQRSHGNTMSKGERHTVMVPALKEIVKRGGKLVYFENSERIDYLENRELYLRLMTGGLLNLFEMLSANGPFGVDICIAMRVVRDSNGGSHLINDAEYISKLRAYILEGWKNHTFDIINDAQINISIQDARYERRLQLADYACNSRLTRNSHNNFYQSDRTILERLFENAHIFSVKTYAPEKRILTSLAVKDISGALYEYVMSEKQPHDRELREAIFHSVDQTSFYLLRDMMKDFSEDIMHYVLRNNDFEENEALLKRILLEIFPEVEKIHPGLQIDVAKFRILLGLSDMYLREGDIGNAGSAINDMTTLIKSMNYNIENLRWVYFYNDKLALYQINCMDYVGAIKTITRSIDLIESIKDVLDLNDDIKNYYGETIPISDYLGNAYTMRIYAKMFLQKEQSSLYEESLKNDSDRALSQYHYPKELERNQQYRAHIEMVESRCREALSWLFSTAEIESVVENDLKKNCCRYLDYSESENALSKEYYLFYYIEIMQKAQELKDIALADVMYDALLSQKSLYEEILSLSNPESGIASDDRTVRPIYEDFLHKELNMKRRYYHPRELTLWRFASFLFHNETNRDRAFDYYEQALKICDLEKSEYARMQITSLAIAAECLAFAIARNTKIATRDKYAKDLCNRIDKVSKRSDLSEQMQEYVLSVKKVITDYKNRINDDAESFAKELLSVSEKIVF